MSIYRPTKILNVWIRLKNQKLFNMKKSKYLLVITVLFAMFSCTTDTIERVEENAILEDQSELVFKEIISLGFSEKDIVDMGTYSSSAQIADMSS